MGMVNKLVIKIKGKNMKSEWIIKYGNSEIKVINTWFSGISLFVNNELQDKKLGLRSEEMTGHVFDENGERKNIKVRLGGALKIHCWVFIDDKKMTATQVK